MPLSPPGEREELHLRTYEFRGFRRKDRLWDIEGRIADTKSYGFPIEDRGFVEAGEAVHDMSIRLTLDDSLTIQAIEAVTDFSPHKVCPAVTPNFQRMVGVKIGPGWRKAIRDRLGGSAGCTHLAEMLVAMATPAYQTIFPILSRERRKEGKGGDAWPGLVNSCHAYKEDGDLVKRYWPHLHKPAGGEAP